MLKEEIMEKALTIVHVPKEYQLYIEEYGEEGGAMLAWENEEKDEGISISMDFSGNLTDLSIDMTNQNSTRASLTIEEKRTQAEEFLVLHYPDVFQHFSFYKTDEMSQATRFNYEQIVMDLPLEELSCIIDIDRVGNIVRFCYDGVKVIPEIPQILISKEKLIREVEINLNLDLKIINLNSEFHDVEEEGLRLVYEPEQSFMKYKADVLKPTLTIEREDEVETLIPLPASSITHKEFTNEEIIGITEQMEIIREVDMGSELGIVWRNRNWKSDETDLSIEGLFQRHTEDTVKAFIAKKSGKIKSFLWFNERKGDLELSRESCYLIGIEFLQTLIPDYYQYLQLIVREDDDEEEDDDFQKELFLFELNNGYGVPVELGMVTIAINRTTGKVDHFSGPSFDIELMSEVPSEPVISKNEASKIFNDHLDFELAWKNDYDSETDAYILVYEACNQETKTALQYVDAMTGQVISSRDY